MEKEGKFGEKGRKGKGKEGIRKEPSHFKMP